jgi:hypothetical protein
VRPRFLAAACAALIVGSCGPATSTASFGPGPSVASERPTAAPLTAAPSRTSRPSQAVVIPHDAPELEARLPDEVDGATLTKLSVGPDTSFSDSGPADAQGMKDLAAEIGDGSGEFGVAYAADPANTFNLFALRVNGADPSTLATKFAQIAYSQAIGGSFESAHLAGRDVVHIVDPFSEIGDLWFYADGDTLLGAQAESPARATDLFALIK